MIAGAINGPRLIKGAVMKIKMLKSKKGSVDGVTVKLYTIGSEVDLPEDLAEVFLSIGVAEVVKENRIEPEPIETPEKMEEAEEAMEVPEKPKKGWRKK